MVVHRFEKHVFGDGVHFDEMKAFDGLVAGLFSSKPDCRLKALLCVLVLKIGLVRSGVADLGMGWMGEWYFTVRYGVFEMREKGVKVCEMGVAPSADTEPRRW